MRKLATLFCVISVLLLSSFILINEIKIDTLKSEVTFEIGNMGVKTVEGSFGEMAGKIRFSESELESSRFQACIKASSVNTGSEKRDDHLRKEDFFHTDKYPKICFISTSISKVSDGYLAKGKLTMHGVTKLVEIPFTYKNEIFKGDLKLNRYDYKIGVETGTFMVSNEVEIKIEAHLVNQK